MKLKLVSNFSKKVYEITDLEDRNISRLNYAFDIRLPEGIEDGEYNYELYAGDEVISRGLVQVGNYNPEVTAYTNTDIINNNEDVIIYNG